VQKSRVLHKTVDVDFAQSAGRSIEAARLFQVSTETRSFLRLEPELNEAPDGFCASGLVLLRPFAFSLGCERGNLILSK
jgi:hypothetical protein